MDIMILAFQILGGILIALSVIFIILLFPPTRRKLKEINISKDGYMKEFANFYDEHLHSFVLVRQILLFLLPTTVLMVLSIFISVKLEHLLGSFVLGISLVIFVSIQLPLLMKARILTTFIIDRELQGSKLNFKSGKTTYVECTIYNLGFSTYKNFTIIFYFREDFEIIPYDNRLYYDLDFKKKFAIQKRHGGIAFNPKESFLTIPPQEIFVFPMFIKAPKVLKEPKEKKEHAMKIEFYSENTWGKTEIYKPLIVER